jgi:uncharacterized protein DUF1499
MSIQGNFMGVILNLGATIAFVAIALGVLSGTGYKMNWWELGMAFKLLQYSLYAGGGAAALGFVSLIFSKKRALALVVLIAGGGVSVMILGQVFTARNVPIMHDISTDTQNPPQFDKIVALRGENSNSIDYKSKMAPKERGSEEMIPYPEMQASYYPDIKALDLELAPHACFVLAEETAGAQGWEVVNADGQKRIVEATDTTFWFGFKDDIVIRITGETTCRVDVRSSSRVGMSDVGVNANRIADYLADLAAAAG